MYLQGNLQSVFDALYHMGLIDPVLEKDWSKLMDQLPGQCDEFFSVIKVANNCQADLGDLINELEKFSEETLTYLAMEVAREYADFHSREDLQ